MSPFVLRPRLGYGMDKMFLGGVKLIHLFLVCGFPALSGAVRMWMNYWSNVKRLRHQATNNNHATTSVVVSDYQVKINH